jgi:hypothetical protein
MYSRIKLCNIGNGVLANDTECWRFYFCSSHIHNLFYFMLLLRLIILMLNSGRSCFKIRYLEKIDYRGSIVVKLAVLRCSVFYPQPKLTQLAHYGWRGCLYRVKNIWRWDGSWERRGQTCNGQMCNADYNFGGHLFLPMTIMESQMMCSERKSRRKCRVLVE